MKVLLAVPYIYDKRYREFTKNSTGLGIILTQIYRQITRNNETYLISHVLTKGHDGILPHTLGNVLRHMRWKDLVQGIRWAFSYKQGLSGRLRYFYYAINKGYILHTIQRLQPDIVHIHGVNIPNRPYIEACQELGVKYAITLHGLKGLDETVKTSAWNKSYEKEALLDCEQHNIPVTVISTGIKKRIEKYYLNGQSRCITVVPNGTDVSQKKINREADLRKTYNIPNEAMIAVSVGAVTENKNQMQIVEAMPLALQNAPKDLYLFLCGTDCMGGAVQQRVEELGLTDHVFVLGYVPYEQMGNMYAQADFNILASLNEGFGLGIIEAFVYGLPSVTFADLDAIPDLYHEATMLLCTDRSTEALASAICQTMDTEWNKEQIMEYSKNFSLEQMAKNYQQVFQKAIES